MAPVIGESVTVREYLENQVQHEKQLREADDRRYYEVNIEKEKALKIKEEADKAALGLAREIQTYKDEKANELREQINSERGLYATKDDVIAASAKLEATIEPLIAFVNSQVGKGSGQVQQWMYLVGGLGALSTITFLIFAIAGKIH